MSENPPTLRREGRWLVCEDNETPTWSVRASAVDVVFSKHDGLYDRTGVALPQGGLALVYQCPLGYSVAQVRALIDDAEEPKVDPAPWVETLVDGVVVDRDENAWCARLHDFEDLAHSPAGFGATADEAIEDLRRSVVRDAVKRAHERAAQKKEKAGD